MGLIDWCWFMVDVFCLLLICRCCLLDVLGYVVAVFCGDC